MTIKAIVFDAYGTLYDVQSVARLIDNAFPGHGEFITQTWRIKQLEYTWLRSMMGKYQDFQTITKESLAFTLDVVGLKADANLFNKIVDTYNNLNLYPEAKAALESLIHYHLAILSNGSPNMLQALVQNTGLDHLIRTTISVDAKKVFKPDPRAYALVEERLGLPPNEVLFVSSNGFDVSGAKSFGFKVARIERITRDAVRAELADAGSIGPSKMFKALRSQLENIGSPPDFVVASLSDLRHLASSGFRLCDAAGTPSST